MTLNMRNFLLIAFCYVLAGLLFSPLSFAGEGPKASENTEAEYVRTQCENLLSNWRARSPAEVLAEKVSSRALLYNDASDGEGDPRYVRNIGAAQSQGELFSLSLETIEPHLMSYLEREIFQISSENVPLAEIRFSLMLRSNEVVTLNVFRQDEIISQVDLDMNSSLFGYVDYVDERVERFKQSEPIGKDDVLEKRWPQLTDAFRRLAVLQPRDSIFTIGFLFHISLADFNGDDFYVRGRPIDIVLLRDCSENHRPGNLVVTHPTDGSRRSLCVSPIGAITRPKLTSRNRAFVSQ